MRVYDQSHSHDLLLARWWAELQTTGDIAILDERHRTLGGFYELFRLATLLFEADGEGVFVALWYLPFLGGANASLWVAPRARRRRVTYQHIETMFATALQQWRVLIGFVGNPALLRLHRKMGYAEVGDVSVLFDQPTWLVMLTRDGFEKRAVRRG